MSRRNKNEKTGVSKSKRVLAQDVAAEVGVSVSTVSRAFSRDGKISPETRSRILSVAEGLGYTPNPFASGLITKKSNIVCIFVSEIFNPFFPELITILTQDLQSAGYMVMLLHVPIGEPVENNLPAALRYNPRFIVITTATTTFPEMMKEDLGGTDVLFFNRYLPGNQCVAVTCDNFKGGYELADLLIGSGHRNLGFIAGTPFATTSIDRGHGFVERCSRSGVKVTEDNSSDSFSYENGYAAACSMLKEDPTIDGIFCANDIMAIGAIDALRDELGLSVPRDISVVGFDDLQMAGWPCHKITTYRYPRRRMISELINLIVEIDHGEKISPITKVVTGELVPRDTHMNRQKNDRMGSKLSERREMDRNNDQ